MSKSKKILLSVAIVIVAAVLATTLTGQYDSSKKNLPQRFIIILAAGAVIGIWQIKRPVNQNNNRNNATGN